MAGVRIGAVTGAITFSTSTKTLAQIIAATNQRVVIERIGISFNGISASEVPVLVEILRQTTSGTVTSLTINKLDSTATETLQTTGGHTATVEPTASTILAQRHVHPQSAYEFVFPPDRPLVIPGGGRVGIRVNTPGQAGNASVWFDGQE